MDHFLDTSWTLHHPTTPSPSYQKLLKSPPTTQAQLDRTFSRLPEFLRSQISVKDDLDDSASKLGVLRECTSTLCHLPSTHQSHSTAATDTETTYILIRLIYTTATFTVILYTPTLILIKAPATLSKHTLSFLSDTFAISTVPLKLPSTLLSQILETYISTLTSSTSNSNDDSSLETETRASILKTAIGTLRLSISFPGPVGPNLRTLDLSVPFETVEALLSSTSSSSLSNSGSRTQTFASTLAHHLHLQTGLKLPLSTYTEDDEQDETVATSTPRLSKIACAAFAISVEGRLRFAAKAVEGAGNGRREDVVVQANLGVLSGIVSAIRGWGGNEG